LHGHQFIHVDTHVNAGGIGLYDKQHIEFLVLTNVKNEIEDCENLSVELKHNHKTFAVGVVYKHSTPSQPSV